MAKKSKDAWAIRIGLRIKALREGAHPYLSLGDLAARTQIQAAGWQEKGLSKNQISNYEQGIRKPGPREATVLGKALGVPPCEVLCLDDDVMALAPREKVLVMSYREIESPAVREAVGIIVGALDARSAESLRDPQRDQLYSDPAAHKLARQIEKAVEAGGKDDVSKVPKAQDVSGALRSTPRGRGDPESATRGSIGSTRKRSAAAGNRKKPSAKVE